MKILVTGADGLLGSNLVRELLQRGYSIQAFLQPGRQQETLKDLNIEKFIGDLLNSDDVLNSSKRCDVIIHCAANTSVWPARSEKIIKVNVEGTQNIIKACYQNKIKRLIYVGTANSFGFGTKEKPGIEGNPYKSGMYGLDYMDSKYRAQQLILKEVKEKGLPALIVNPTFMFGPYDSTPSSGAMILAIHKGKVPGYTKGGRNYICVKDAAIGIANALTKGRVGECYILSGQNYSYKEIFSKIAKTIGAPAPRFYIPPVIAKIFGRAGSLMGLLIDKPPAISYAMARISCDEHYYSAEKSIRELELPQTPIESGIDECYRWLKSNGYMSSNSQIGK